VSTGAAVTQAGRPRGRYWRGRAAAVAATLLLATGGCVQLLPDPGDAPLVSALQADPATPRAERQAAFSVGVGLPTMPRMLAGTQIVVVDNDGSFAYLEGVRLATNATTGFQDVVLGTFDRAGSVRAAVRAITIARPDYELHFDISRFDVTRPEGRRPGRATVEAAARIVEVPTGRLIASRVLKAEAPAPRGAPLQAVRALETASRAVASEAMTWSIARIESMRAPAAAAPPVPAGN
jgi:cholesterol transport system auxiliary component